MGVWVKFLGFAGMLFIYLKVASKELCQITLLYTSELSPHPRISSFQKEHFTFYETSENVMCCSNWSSGVYFLNQGHMM